MTYKFFFFFFFFFFSRNRHLFLEFIQCIQQIASFCIWLFGDHVYLSQKFHKTVLFHFTDDEIEILEMQSQNHSPDQVRISLCFAKIYIVHSMSKPKVIVLKTKKGIYSWFSEVPLC